MAQHPSQSDQVLYALLQGQVLSALDIFHEFGSMRAAALIHYLRRKRKVPILSIPQIVIDGTKRIRFVLYQIAPEHLQEQRARFGL